MTKLMQQHRHEQQQRSEQPHRPADPVSTGRSWEFGDLLLKGHGEQHQNNEPTGMDPQRDPADSHQLPAITQMLLRRAGRQC